MVEFEYDMTKWLNARVWSGGPVEDWELPGSKQATPVHPRDMMDYHGLSSCWPRDLYSRAICLAEEQHLEVINLQEDLKFHFYYTGLEPRDGTEDPKEWLCLLVYDRRNWEGIARGLSQLGIPLEASPEELVDKDTDDLAIQMMLRASDAWITYCDPWLKQEFSDSHGVLEPGKVYRYKEDGLKDKLGIS
eukprot:TRINITY_DN84101_c0_g1_i1.p1 TRINITY_DN84101_c0_g1~~TRINITY_DN84101_c0_g1_i1.p1  ORF type:complete len:215 (-),score=53.06 TRINITY_DN84101_c0_g1_i1:46-615(-)